MKYIIVGLFFYVVITHLLCFNNYKFCKQKKKGIDKECRNLTCKYSKDCVYNTLYNNSQYENKCEENKLDIVAQQKEIEKTISCPLCGNKEFYTNLYLIGYGYSGAERKIAFMSNRYSPEITQLDAVPSEQGIKVKYKVCKKCGYIISLVDMDTLDKYTFRPDKDN